MKNITISQVSKHLGIFTRMLRYYEQAGLVVSARREGEMCVVRGPALFFHCNLEEKLI